MTRMLVSDGLQPCLDFSDLDLILKIIWLCAYVFFLQIWHQKLHQRDLWDGLMNFSFCR